jgi:hypothetical protein
VPDFRAIDGAQNKLLDLEELEQEEISDIREDYRRLAAQALSSIGWDCRSDCPPAPV